MGLPVPVLIRRINNELVACSEYLGIDIPAIPEDFDGFPITVEIVLRNVPAYDLRDGEVVPISDHRVALTLSKEYGYSRPDARWQTSIFHPNIMVPEEGGYLCLRTADVWGFGSTLLSYIKSIEQLVMSPNPRKPFGTDRCMRAARYMMDNESKIEISLRYGGR